MEIKKEIILEDGKYIFQLLENGIFRCLQHGKGWRILTGDKAVFALFQNAIEMQNTLADISYDMVDIFG